MTPRDNLLRTFRCQPADWIPISLLLTPREHPTAEVPAELADVFAPGNITWGDWGKNNRLLLKLGDHLGAEEYMAAVNGPAHLVSKNCPAREEQLNPGQKANILSTPKGELRQVTTLLDKGSSDSYPFRTERYLKTAEDAVRLTAYFDSMSVETLPGMVEAARAVKARVGDRGVIFCRAVGTPLGMCYREFADLTNLIYLLADEPAVMEKLFAVMEEKYFKLYERMLVEAPEIDMLMGMDDTSTTLISPAMFERFNVKLTSARADLCHGHGKLYLHHSCGLIRDLLPVYRKTRMDGVDGFTPPPIGNVGYAEGRELLGEGYSIMAGGLGAVPSFDGGAIEKHVAQRMSDARRAGHVILGVSGAHLPFPAMARIFEVAQKEKRR